MATELCAPCFQVVTGVVMGRHRRVFLQSGSLSSLRCEPLGDYSILKRRIEKLLEVD